MKIEEGKTYEFELKCGSYYSIVNTNKMNVEIYVLRGSTPRSVADCLDNKLDPWNSRFLGKVKKINKFDDNTYSIELDKYSIAASFSNKNSYKNVLKRVKP
jgi:hypothetical protein